MAVLWTILIYTLICLYEVPSLLKKEQQRDLVIFIAILVPAMTLSLLLGAGVNLPYILPAIDRVLRPILSAWGLL